MVEGGEPREESCGELSAGPSCVRKEATEPPQASSVLGDAPFTLPTPTAPSKRFSESDDMSPRQLLLRLLQRRLLLQLLLQLPVWLLLALLLLLLPGVLPPPSGSSPLEWLALRERAAAPERLIGWSSSMRCSKLLAAPAGALDRRGDAWAIKRFACRPQRRSPKREGARRGGRGARGLGRDQLDSHVRCGAAARAKALARLAPGFAARGGVDTGEGGNSGCYLVRCARIELRVLGERRRHMTAAGRRDRVPPLRDTFSLPLTPLPVAALPVPRVRSPLRGPHRVGALGASRLAGGGRLVGRHQRPRSPRLEPVAPRATLPLAFTEELATARCGDGGVPRSRRLQ